MPKTIFENLYNYGLRIACLLIGHEYTPVGVDRKNRKLYACTQCRKIQRS